MNKKLQIFVSSTYTDLREERQAAVEAILKSGHIPAGMELFSAGSLSQMDVIKRWIDESDVYMLILGGRYGSVEASTGVSYTELEYDYAKQQGKPIFSVVINKDAIEKKCSVHGTDAIETKYPAELSQFREKVLTLMCAFFDDLKDIKLAVHESMSDYKNDPLLKGWVSGTNIEDHHFLSEELKRVLAENSELKRTIDELKSSEIVGSNKTNYKEHDFQSIDYNSLMVILKSVKLNVPDNLKSQYNIVDSSLFDISYKFINTLTVGFTNKMGGSDLIRFLYFNVIPKLQIHGLADTEEVPNMRYRRASLTIKGRSLFASYEASKSLLSNDEAAVTTKVENT